MTLEDVKNLLGHRSITLTSNTYGHVLAGRQRSFIDQRAGGVPVFMFVGDADAQYSEISRRVPGGTIFQVRAAQRTVTDLQALQDRLERERNDLLRVGVDVATVGLHEPTNTVLVGVPKLGSEVVAKLKDRYGDAVSVREEGPIVMDACTSTANCPPAKGGIRVQQANGNWCTAGFVAKWLGSSTLTIRLLTAGHCIELIGSSTWYHHGVALGSSGNEWWYNHTNSDVGTIVESPSGAKNLFYASGPTDVRSVTSVEPVANQDAGDYVCGTGSTTGYRCGNISRTDITALSEGYFIYHAWETDFDGSDGDSGAPFYMSNSAYGIHMDSTVNTYTGPKWSWYTPVYWMQDTSDFALCVTASCT